MKAYIGMIGAVICTALLLNGCTGKDQTKESSIEEVSVVSRTLTAYEKKHLMKQLKYLFRTPARHCTNVCARVL